MGFNQIRIPFLVFFLGLNINCVKAFAEIDEREVLFPNSAQRTVQGMKSLDSIQVSISDDHLEKFMKILRIKVSDWSWKFESIESSGKSTNFTGTLHRMEVQPATPDSIDETQIESNNGGFFGFLSSAITKVTQQVSHWITLSVVGSVTVVQEVCASSVSTKCFLMNVDISQSNPLVSNMIQEMKIHLDLKEEKTEETPSTQFDVKLGVIPGYLFPGMDHSTVISTLNDQIEAWADALVEYSAEIEVGLVRQSFQ